MHLPNLAQYIQSLPEVCASTPEKHLAMLAEHFHAPARRITATELANAAGYATYGAANLQYGIFAHRLCDALGFVPPIGNSGAPTYTYVLASPRKLPHADWEWTMHEVVAEAIEQTNLFGNVENAANTAPVYPEEAIDTRAFIEGATKTVTVNAYERKPEARIACLEYWGTSCTVCDMDFQTTYGANPVRCIHVHHLHPLSAIGTAHTVDVINDLRPVCPNCHTVLHTTTPPLSISELRARLREKRG